MAVSARGGSLRRLLAARPARGRRGDRWLSAIPGRVKCTTASPAAGMATAALLKEPGRGDTSRRGRSTRGESTWQSSSGLLPVGQVQLCLSAGGCRRACRQPARLLALQDEVWSAEAGVKEVLPSGHLCQPESRARPLAQPWPSLCRGSQPASTVLLVRNTFLGKRKENFCLEKQLQLKSTEV